MNKIISYLKYLLMIILVLLYIMYFKKFNNIIDGNLLISHFCLIILLVVLMLLSILDFKQKNHQKVYNLLFIFIELLLMFVFLRTLYDPNFIFNSPNYDFKVEGAYAGAFNIAYLLQNVKYFVIMLIVLIIYRKINK